MLLHSDDDIALFVPFFNIAMRLDNLFQRITSIDDRFYLPASISSLIKTKSSVLMLAEDFTERQSFLF